MKTAFRYALLLSMTLLAGCEQKGAANSASPTTPATSASSPPQQTARTDPFASVIIKNNTPDIALKSWWALIDARDRSYSERCDQPEPRGFIRYRDEILTGDAKDFSTRNQTSCAADTFGREIDEVKVESDSRATILATIKNTTSIPRDAHMSESQEKSRSTGERYKYVLERTSNHEGWKVSQVFSHNDYASTGEPEWRLEI
jgi:hypothetical protein